MGLPSKVWVFCARITNLRSKEWVYHGRPMQRTYNKSTVLNYGHRRRAAWSDPPLKCIAISWGNQCKWTKQTRQFAIQTVIQTCRHTFLCKIKEFCDSKIQVFSRPVRLCFKFTVKTIKVCWDLRGWGLIVPVRYVEVFLKAKNPWPITPSPTRLDQSHAYSHTGTH